MIHHESDETRPSARFAARAGGAISRVLLALGLIAFLAVAGVRVGGPTPVSAQAMSNDDVVQAYLDIINAGFQTADFSALAMVLAPDATLTKSNPDGKTTVYHGLDEILGFYQGFQAANPGLQFTTDSRRDLDDTTVLSYESAVSPTLSVPGRCSHVFELQDGKITSYDWATFFPGKP